MLSLLEKVRERGELPRVEWQANDHLLRMRAGARVAASRRHEPDRSEVQPRVALSVIIVTEAQRCLLAARRIAASHRRKIRGANAHTATTAALAMKNPCKS